MMQQLINWVASWSGEFVLALMGLLGGLICFVVWDRRLKSLEINRLRLETIKLTLDIKKLQKETSPIALPTAEEIRRYGQQLHEPIDQKKPQIYELLEGKSIEANRLQLDLWFEILKTGGKKTEEIFHALISLAKSAGEKGIALEVLMMTHIIGHQEKITIEDKSTMVQMSEEMVLYFIQGLDKLINTDRIDKYNTAVQTEQLGNYCLLRSTGLPKEAIDSMINLDIE